MKRSRIGMNVGFIAPYMPMFPFNDRAKSAEYGWKNGETQVWGTQPGTAGDYDVYYPGGTPVVTKGGTLTNAGPGRWTLKANGGELKIRVPDTLKLIRILPAGVDPAKAEELSDHFKASKAPFRVLRLLDVTSANWVQGPLTAGNRPKVTDQFWSDKYRGCPLEPFIDYAATNGTTLYVNVPHTATDDYVEWLAGACAAKGVRLRLTYSNETWNSKTYAGGTTWRDGGTGPIPDGGVPKLAAAAGLPTNAYTLKRSIELGKVARRFMPAGIVEVVWEIQIAAGADAARSAWNRIKPAAGEVQYIAGAPYMGDDTASTDPKVHAAAYLAKAKRWQQGIGDTMSGMPKWRQLTADTGTRLICYEANIEPKLGLKDAALAAQRAAANLPEMGEATGRYIDALIAAGFEEVEIFVDFGVGVWALSTDHRKLDTERFKAVADRAAKYQFDDAGPVVTPTPTPPPVTKITLSDPVKQPDGRLKWNWSPAGLGPYTLFGPGTPVPSGNEDAFTPDVPGAYQVKSASGVESNVVRYGADPNIAKKARLVEIAARLTAWNVEQQARDAERTALEVERARLVSEIGE